MRAGPTFSILLLFASIGLIATLEIQRRQPAATSTAATAPAVVAPPVARIVDAARALKLVTWQFETSVDARSVSDRWYGDAVADVRAPVRYQYGVDLTDLRREDVLFDSGGSGRVVFIVAPPKRIAVEVDVQRLEENLKTSGVRWRSQNGSQLEAARKLLAERAEAMTLAPEDQARLQEASREQLAKLLRAAIGGDSFTATSPEVRFAQ